MDAEDIIHTIQEAERRKQVFKYAGRSLAKQTGNAHWQLSLVNDPKAYQASLEPHAAEGETGFFKFKVRSLEEGKKICKDIFDFHEVRQAEIIFDNTLDAAKPIYLTVHILYGAKVEKPA